MMEITWTHNDYQINEGLKPGAEHFQYFFMVSQAGVRKCKYCVWIEDETLERFDPAKRFDAIVAKQQEAWRQWVREKIDRRDFNNIVLRYSSAGENEIDLEQMQAKLSMD